MVAFLTVSTFCSAVLADPKSDYSATCAACHNLGVAGAPKLGDKEAWKQRIAKGSETLYDHAINGFVGELGAMPAKGGFTSLSDQQVKAIVEYMVSASQ